MTRWIMNRLYFQNVFFFFFFHHIYGEKENYLAVQIGGEKDEIN